MARHKMRAAFLEIRAFADHLPEGAPDENAITLHFSPEHCLPQSRPPPFRGMLGRRLASEHLRMHTLTQTLYQRALENWRDSFASAVAACLAWLLSQWLFGHPAPLFAAITAIVCLAPGLPSHGQQAIGLLIGVATGIAVGEAALLLPEDSPLLRIGLATFIAMLIASLYGLLAVVAIQAGISAVLVLAFGPATAGEARMLDVLVGAAVGLMFSQVLLTPNPVRLIEAAAKSLLKQLAKGFGQAHEAISKQDWRKAAVATRTFSAAHAKLIDLDSGILRARGAVRWTIRGRFVAQVVHEMAARYDRRAIRLYASALLFAESLEEALRKQEAPPPAGLKERVAHVERLICASAKDINAPRASHFDALPLELFPPSWQLCLDNLGAVEDALSAFNTSGGA